MSKSIPARHRRSVTEDQAVELADMFRMMGDPSRLRITFACLDQPVCVGDIAQSIGLSPSLVSHHLRLLRASRILRAERRGKQIFYSAADEHISRVLRDMADHVGEAREHD